MSRVAVAWIGTVLRSGPALVCRLAVATTGHGEGFSVESRRFRMDDGYLTLRIRPSGDLCYIKTLGANRIPGMDEFAC